LDIAQVLPDAELHGNALICKKRCSAYMVFQTSLQTFQTKANGL